MKIEDKFYEKKSMSFLDEVYDLFQSYYLKQEFSEKNFLRSKIEQLVLTGEQILDSGITGIKDCSDKENQEKYKEEMQNIGVEILKLQKKIENWKKAYSNLKQIYLKKENPLVWIFIDEIEKILDKK